MRIRLALCSIICLSVLALAGCAGAGTDAVYTYGQSDGGNIAATDSLGSGMSRHVLTQTAAVESNR